jgi:hypothetical protein
MLTDAKIAANQANAQHSTGPRTPEGKAAVSQNSVTLGLFSARDLVRPEDQSEYDELRAGLEAELCPATTMERTHAMEILHASWRLRRCAVVEAGLLESTIQSGLDPMEDKADSGVTQSAIDRARAHARNNLRRASEDLSRLQTERRLRAELETPAAPDVPGEAPKTEGLASHQSITKTLALDVRRRLALRKLAGTDTFESLLQHALAQKNTSITKQTHGFPENPPSAPFTSRPS